MGTAVTSAAPAPDSYGREVEDGGSEGGGGTKKQAKRWSRREKGRGRERLGVEDRLTDLVSDGGKSLQRKRVSIVARNGLGFLSPHCRV
jgi:hypothetical protein